MNIQSNPVNTDPEGAIKSVLVNGVSLFGGLYLEKIYSLHVRALFSRDKANCP